MLAKIEKSSAEAVKLKILYLHISSKMKPSMNSYECHFVGLQSNLFGVLNYMQTHYKRQLLNTYIYLKYYHLSSANTSF